MRAKLTPLSLVSMLLVVLNALPAECASSKQNLSQKETADLFAALSKAAKTAKTFQADMTRTEANSFVLDEEPLVSRGKVWIVRPSHFRQDITKPRPSTTVANDNDLWVHFPEAKEVQHVDLAKGVKGKAGSSLDAVMPWLTFDLEGLEKKFKVKAKMISLPKGMALRVYPKDAKTKVEDLEPQIPGACYRIDFQPKDPKSAPELSLLSLWVDGVNPWLLKFERESTDESIQTTEFSNIVLEAPIDAKVFEFKAPRGTKTVELSG